MGSRAFRPLSLKHREQSGLLVLAFLFDNSRENLPNGVERLRNIAGIPSFGSDTARAFGILNFEKLNTICRLLELAIRERSALRIRTSASISLLGIEQCARSALYN